MGLGVGGVVELVGNEGAGNGGRQLFSLADGAQHPLRARGQDQLSAVAGHQLLPLYAHGVGHDDDGPVAPGGGHSRQSDAGVAGGGLDDGCAGLQQAPLLRVVQHGPGHPVLGGAAGVEAFQLDQELCGQAVKLLHPAKLNQGRSSDELLGSGVNVGHKTTSKIDGSIIRRGAAVCQGK